MTQISIHTPTYRIFGMSMLSNFEYRIQNAGGSICIVSRSENDRIAASLCGGKHKTM